MAYYVRPNRHPRERAELRIVIKVREGQMGRKRRVLGAVTAASLSFRWEGCRGGDISGKDSGVARHHRGVMGGRAVERRRKEKGPVEGNGGLEYSSGNWGGQGRRRVL